MWYQQKSHSTAWIVFPSKFICWNPTPTQYLRMWLYLNIRSLRKWLGAWWAAVHGVAKSQTRLSDFTFTLHFHALEKDMATHPSVLTWRIPGTEEPGGLPSVGSHRVGHDWNYLAAAYMGVYMYPISSVQFSLSVVIDCLWSHEMQHARPPWPTPTPGVYPNSYSLSQWGHPTISSSVVPFSSCP